MKISPSPIDPITALNLKAESIDKIKNIYCVNYSKCLNLALKNDWANFRCNGCEAHQTIGQEQFDRDVEALTVCRKASENIEKFGHANRIKGVKPGADGKVKARVRLPMIMQRIEADNDNQLAALVLA